MADNRNFSPVKFYQCVIQAGHIAYSYDPSYLCTVCGNGVIVTIQDPHTKTGGMAHCVYPKLPTGLKASNYHSKNAIYSLYKKLTEKKKLSLYAEAQLFGGGNIHGLKKERAQSLVADIRNRLKQLNIKITSEDIGGNLGRKIIFNTYNGETIVFKTKKIRKTDWLPEFSRK